MSEFSRVMSPSTAPTFCLGSRLGPAHSFHNIRGARHPTGSSACARAPRQTDAPTVSPAHLPIGRIIERRLWSAAGVGGDALAAAHRSEHRFAVEDDAVGAVPLLEDLEAFVDLEPEIG
jgi:hypothetical protein